ncbi:MAG: hypothetical protein MSJ26_10465, partial [Oscillospiraceae bacterium]|nr:hypothetical protein [Oscillospiraceae bacterium]
MSIVSVKKILPFYKQQDFILIFNQPIDKFDSYNAATRRQAPLPGDSPPAVAFLDWQRSICRLCL